MSFFNKLKGKLGYGLLDIEIQAPDSVERTSGSVSGSLVITAKQEGLVLTDLKIELEREFSKGQGTEKQTKRNSLGETKQFSVNNQQIDFQAGTKLPVSPASPMTFAFSLPFTNLVSGNELLQSQQGALGTLGKMGAWVGDEKSTFTLKVAASTEGGMLPVSKIKGIQLV